MGIDGGGNATLSLLSPVGEITKESITVEAADLVQKYRARDLEFKSASLLEGAIARDHRCDGVDGLKAAVSEHHLINCLRTLAISQDADVLTDCLRVQLRPSRGVFATAEIQPRGLCLVPCSTSVSLLGKKGNKEAEGALKCSITNPTTGGIYVICEGAAE